MGKGGASVFCPLKWKARLSETMPDGSLDIASEIVFGITPDSRVTLSLKKMTNAGIAAASGWSPVPRVNHEVI